MSCSNYPNSSPGEQQRNQTNSSLSVSSLSEMNSRSRVSVHDLDGASVPTPPRVNSPPPSTHAVNLTALFEEEAPQEGPNEFPTFEIVNDDSSSIWPELMDSDECRPLNSCRVSAVPPEGWIPADASDDNWLYDDDEPSKDVTDDSKVVPSMIGAGLANLGNTCFLNSIMQCFTHTVPLVEGLLLCSHSPNDGHNGYCVICAFRYHVRHSLQSTGRIFSPVILVDNLNHFSSLFRRHQQEDAHEFMQCALDKLERCFLNLKKNDPSFEDDNIVNKVFGGRLVSKLRCCNCGRSSDTNEPLIDLSLEIENVETLSSALESFTMVEDIDAKFRCEGCKEEVSMEKQLMLDQTPSIATFHLKRFKTDGILVEKIDKHINFPLELDLQPFTISNENNNVSLKYDLYAVVVHSGFSSTSGHYFCFVRSAPDTWHKLDDSKVSKVSEETVLSQEGYILFYARQGTPWISSFMESQIPCLDLSRMNTSPKSVLDITDGQNKSFSILHENIDRSKADESKEFSEKYSLQESCEFLEIDDIINATHDYEYEKFPAQKSNQKAVNLNGLEDINAQVLPENCTMMTGNAKHGGSSYTEYGAPDKNNRSPEIVDYRENDCFNPLTPPNSPPFDTPGKTFQISRDHLKIESQGSSGKRSSSNKLTGNSEKKAALTYLKKMSGSRRSVLMDLVGDCHSKSSSENKRKKIDSLQSDKGNTLSARKKSSHSSVTGYPVATRVSQ